MLHGVVDEYDQLVTRVYHDLNHRVWLVYSVCGLMTARTSG